MDINNIPGSGPVKKNGVPRANRISPVKPAPALHIQDKVELVSQHDRDVVLNSIKAKINQGFYKSEEVTDDITEKLAQLFERAK